MTTQNLLTRDEVLTRLKISRATLYALMERDGFPRPIKLGASNRWLKLEVDGWLETQPRARIQVRDEQLAVRSRPLASSALRDGACCRPPL